MHSLTADVNIQSPGWQAALPQLEALVALIIEEINTLHGVRSGVRSGEFSIIFTDDAKIRVLNKTYRGENKPTNVLSFAFMDNDEFICPNDDPYIYGDVFVARETMMREATGYSKSLYDHTAHLITHGVLHLLGFDHVTAEDARKMEDLERGILHGIGIADPYGEEIRKAFDA